MNRKDPWLCNTKVHTHRVTLMAIVGLVSIVVLAVVGMWSSSAYLGDASMASIFGACGGCDTTAQGDCTGTGTSCSGGCSAQCGGFTLGGIQPQVCEDAENDKHCVPNGTVTCKQPYSCSTNATFGLKCEVGTGCVSGLLQWCNTCTSTAGAPITAPTYYCGS